MLFVPGDQPRMLAKAPTLDADAIILDVEDGVAAKDKQIARASIEAAVRSALRVPGTLWVRPNGLATGMLEDDLLACLWPPVTGVVVPKVRSAHEVRIVDGVVGRLARDRGMDRVWLAILIETARATAVSVKRAGVSATRASRSSIRRRSPRRTLRSRRRTGRLPGPGESSKRTAPRLGAHWSSMARW